MVPESRSLKGAVSAGDIAVPAGDLQEASSTCHFGVFYVL